ncbi:MAG: tetratricopeptide repeat protein [Gemmataceae bacterium]
MVVFRGNARIRQAHEIVDSAPLVDDLRLGLHQAKSYWKLDQKDKAENKFRAAISAHYLDPAAWQVRARVFGSLGMHNRAEADFAKAIDLQPKDATNWIARARYFTERGKAKEADSDYTKAASLTPDELNKFVEGGWWVAGPYPEDIKHQCPPEIEADPAKPVLLTSGVPALSWRPISTQEHGKVDFHRVFDADHLSAYAMTYVYSPDDRSALLRVGNDDFVRLWVNGRLVHEESTKANIWLGGLDLVPITLHAGRNTLLAKVANRTGDHSLFLRISDDPLDRAVAYAEYGLWKESAEQLEKASSQSFPEILPQRFATLLVAAGDNDGYRRYRKQLLQRADGALDPFASLETAFACSLMADSDIDWNRLVALARKWKEPDSNIHWNDFYGGFTFYRANQFEEAIRLIEVGEPQDPKTWPVLAMAHHRQPVERSGCRLL